MMTHLRFLLRSEHTFMKALSVVIAMIGVFFSSSVQAAVTADVSTMLLNFSQAVPNLMQMVTAFAYVLGFFFIIRGVIELKQFGESRSMMSQEHSLAKPLMTITVGALLLYLPSSVQTGLSTFWTTPSPYGYVSSSSSDSWSAVTNAAFMVIQLIGVIAFIKGLVMLTHLHGHGGQPGGFSKAMAHIVAGILCINLYQFLQTVFDTLGITGFSL